MAPKLSKKEKAELAAAQAAEAEAARLAEEARLAAEKAAEEARMAAELKERQAAEAAMLAELDARLDSETAANAPLYGAASTALQKEALEAFSQEEWAVYIACDPLPDVQRESSVNTFLTEWSELPAYGADAMTRTLADCTLCTELMKALQLEAAFSAGRGEAKQALWQHEIQALLKEEMQKKIDGATADFLSRAEEFANMKTLQCLTTIAAMGARFGLWVNLAKNPRMKLIDFDDLNVTCELPKALALASIAVRVVHYASDYITSFAPPEKLASAEWMTLGGVFEVSLLNLPPPSKKIKGWTMRPVTEMTTSVSRMPYPLPQSDGSAPPPGTAPLLKFTYIIDDAVILPEKIDTVGFWDTEANEWSTDKQAVADVEFAYDTRTLTFHTTSLCSLALLQPTTLELPYKKWIFTPSGSSSGTLYLSTQRFEVVIDVSAKGCTLKSPDKPELASILNVPMAAGKLLLRLKGCGINLQPKDADASKLKKVVPKDVGLEKALHAALTPLVSRYQLAPSRWNPSRGPKKITVRLSKSDAFDAEDEAPPPADPYAASEGDWPCLEYAYRRATLISALDADATCNETPLKEGVSHSTPLECLKGEDPDVTDVLHSSSHLYQDTVRQLMDEIRPLSFTAA